MNLEKAVSHSGTASTAENPACKAGAPSTGWVRGFQLREPCHFCLLAVSPWFK
jgi:hypothetical protein